MMLFVGIGLPENETRLFDVIRSEFSNKQLGTPSHITLMAPFLADNPDILLQKMQLFAQEEKKFGCVFDQVGYFRQARYMTLFLGSEDAHDLIDMQKRLRAALGKSEENRAFIPHLTLANQVKYEDFDKVKEKLELMQLALHIEINELTIYCMKYHNYWEVWQKVPFSNNR